MAAAGLLREEVHGLFNQQRFPAADGRAEADIRRRLEAALLGQGPVEPRTAGLIAVLRGTDALKKVFPDWDRTELKRRAAFVSEGDWAGKAVKDAVGEMEAVMVAIMVSTISAATSSS